MNLPAASHYASFLLAALMTLSAAASATPDVQPHGAMLRYPDVSASQIVFVYADDLWLVSREGGAASPLASPPGLETFPRFSRDGQTIAFTGNYDGNRDIYTLPTAGGVPRRVTHHPNSETVCDWTSGGRLLFFTGGFSAQGLDELFTVAEEGGLPERLPVPYGANAAISNDGNLLAYTPYRRDHRTWKRYMGGLAADIWILNLSEGISQKITDWGGTDTQPMWQGKRLYYLSDAGPKHRLNIWVHDTESGESTQVTHFVDFDVKWPSIGPGPKQRGEIVFQLGSDLYLLDLSDGKHRTVEVTIPGARPTIRPHSTNVGSSIAGWDISTTGKRAVVEARGDVWTLPVDKGSPRNLTQTSGSAERGATWSPDGRWVAFFSDESGNYELNLIQSDGKGERRTLTEGSQDYYSGLSWSPDSEHLCFTDQTGKLHLHSLDAEDTQLVDTDPLSSPLIASWSHDSRWLAYARTDEQFLSRSIMLYSVEDGVKHKVTSDMFSDSRPLFDREGDYLFFQSSRAFQPRYSEIDSTFVYDQTEVILAVPLRADMKSPWAPENDEESWEELAEGDDDDGDGDDDDDDGGEDSDAPASDEEDSEQESVSGLWGGVFEVAERDSQPFTLRLELQQNNQLSGSMVSMLGSGEISSGVFDPASHSLTFTVPRPDEDDWVVSGELRHGAIRGQAWAEGSSLEFRGRRILDEDDDDDNDESESEDPDEEEEGEKEEEPLKIDLEGFERRAIMLPIERGQFGSMAVNEGGHLLYVRSSSVPGSPSQVKIFDLEADEPEEKTVCEGPAFGISADGKKLIVPSGNSASVHDASADAKGESVGTQGMVAMIQPREEWKQVFTEAWRLYRQYFYDPNLHGVDWQKVFEQYETMVADCTTREDLSYVIREMISELNVGHAYYRSSGNPGPSVSVGLLGADFELQNGAYRISAIYEGADWDADARGPLSQPGVKVEVGDYLLAVDGVPLDTSRDPWAAFQGSAGRVTTLTVSSNPVIDDDAREILVEPVASERALRYRAWIEHNRAYVERETDGRVGYIYVPDTGVNGQNDLVRQYFGQIGKEALLIDERWNRGGQIPTRFIELLNRPITNYWATRQGAVWPWPYDAHQGPKCMLINARAGSGGDAFPAYFRAGGLGKLIGTRTWGGLVGISGNPQLIDGAAVTVPTFGFYEKDGTWGIEGHGVEPDIEVVDDPALMMEGGDPQLDFAIQHLLRELERRPYRPTSKPPYPDRSGMGLPEADK